MAKIAIPASVTFTISIGRPVNGDRTSKPLRKSVLAMLDIGGRSNLATQGFDSIHEPIVERRDLSRVNPLLNKLVPNYNMLSTGGKP